MTNKYIHHDECVSLARKLAEESIVLLKNEENLLPLESNCKIALFGRTQFDVVSGGSGSGAATSKETRQIASSLKEAGFVLEETVEAFYQTAFENEMEEANEKGKAMANMDLEGLVNSGLIYEIFGKYNNPKEEPLPEQNMVKEAAESTEIAVVVIGRCSGGEECDRRVEKDYYLLDSEKKLIKLVSENFKKVIVIFNTNGAVDMTIVNAYPSIQSALFMGPCGQEGACALAEILRGEMSPSGKLSQTLALTYEDYPSAKHFSSNKDDADHILTYENYGLDKEDNGSIGFEKSPVTVYQEDIYVGYRYFDTFHKPVLYPFGYGLSYADFVIQGKNVEVSNGNVKVTVKVENRSSKYAGKEVVQLYVHAKTGTANRAYQELKAFQKTRLLTPNEQEEMTLSFLLEDLKTFHEEENAWVLEKGSYEILIGNSSKSTAPIGKIVLEEDVKTEEVLGNIGVNPANVGKINFLTATNETEADANKEIPEIKITKKDVVIPERHFANVYNLSVKAKVSTLQDVVDGKVSMEEFVAQMSVEELAVLCTGYGSGLPFAGIGKKAPMTIQYEDGTDIAYNSNSYATPGYINPAMKKYGIYSAVYKDGPAGVGFTAWPSGMMLACSFNKDLLYEFGSASGAEAELKHVDSWLAPGMNIIRNPIEGRAFEYFSEDPYLAGICGVSIAKGTMENNKVTVCPKHFAINEQETYRRGSTKKNYDAVDSILTARAAREIYLKPFEMVIKQAKPNTLMTSFNKINGTFAAGNKELCIEILRKEWGYDGVVVTDWGDLDFVVDGADAVEAGNDVIMPGGPPVIAQILKGYEEGRVSKSALQKAVCHLLYYVMKTKAYEEGKNVSSNQEGC